MRYLSEREYASSQSTWIVNPFSSGYVGANPTSRTIGITMFDYDKMFALVGTIEKITSKHRRICSRCNVGQNMMFNQVCVGDTNPLRCSCGYVIFITLVKMDDEFYCKVDGESLDSKYEPLDPNGVTRE